MKKNYFLLSAIFLLLFIILAVNIGNFSAIDNSINLSISKIQTPSLISISKTIGILFEPTYILVLSLIISAILFFKSRKQSLFFTGTMLFSGIILYALKEIIARARPENSLILESGYSFPSGHVLISLVFFGFLIYLTINNVKSTTRKTISTAILILLILVIGFSRIYLQVHWFSDVLAGFLLGLSILFFSLSISELPK